MALICKTSVVLKTRQINVDKSLPDAVSRNFLLEVIKKMPDPQTALFPFALDFKSIFSVKTQSVKYKEFKTRIFDFKSDSKNKKAVLRYLQLITIK